MNLCPRCKKSVRTMETIKEDKKGKKWAIYSCVHCRFHFDIEEYSSGFAEVVRAWFIAGW